jgi:MFS family permease
MLPKVFGPHRPGGLLFKWYTGQSAVLRYRDLRFFLASTFFISFSYWVEQVALGWLMLELTDSALMVSLAYAARMAPFFFLGIPAGAVADWVDRRLLLRLLTFGIGITWFIVAALAITGAVQPWHIILIAVAAGCMRAFYATTHSALLYDVVGHKGAVSGMAWISIVSHASGVIGALLAGRIVGAVGVGGAYLAAGFGFVAAFAMLLFMREPGQAAPRRRESMGKTARAAIQTLRTNRLILLFVILTAGGEAFGWSSGALLPTLTRDVLHRGPEDLGLLIAVRSAAGMVGPMAVAVITDLKYQRRAMFACVIVFGVSIVGLGFVPNLMLALVALSVANAAGAAVDVLVKPMMQDAVPNEERGRAMGAWTVAIGVGPLGQIEAGGVASAAGVGPSFAMNGGLLLLTSIGVYLPLRRLMKRKEET